MPSHQTYHNCTSWGKEEVLYLCKVIRNPRWLSLGLIGRDIFNVFSKTISFEVTRLVINVPLGVRSPEVLLVFGLIRNPRLRLLIGQNILYFFSRKAACYVNRHSRNVSLEDPMSFYNFYNLISATCISLHMINYKFIYLYIII